MEDLLIINTCRPFAQVAGRLLEAADVSWR